MPEFLQAEPSLLLMLSCSRLSTVNGQIRNKISAGTQTAAAAAAGTAAAAAPAEVADGEQQQGGDADGEQQQGGDADGEQQQGGDADREQAGQASAPAAQQQVGGQGAAPGKKLAFPSKVEWDKVLEWRSYKGRSKEIYDCCKTNKPHKDWEQVCGLSPYANAMDHVNSMLGKRGGCAAFAPCASGHVV
jgi:hypothetical protein